jgi:hypothetical protein
MMALFIAVTAVIVERYISRRRLMLHEVLADVGWLTLVFALIEFAYLFFVEALTYSHGSVARPLWYTEVWVFKDLFLNAAVGVFLILASVWIESAGIRLELRLPRLRMRNIIKQPEQKKEIPQKRCDIEWHEAS